MKYTIDQDNRRVAIELSGCDKLGYYNVPLAKAIVNNGRSERFTIEHNDHCRSVHVDFRFLPSTAATTCVEAEVRMQMGSELTDEPLIQAIKNAAQGWLSNEMTRLLALKKSIETLSEAFPNERSPISKD